MKYLYLCSVYSLISIFLYSQQENNCDYFFAKPNKITDQQGHFIEANNNVGVIISNIDTSAGFISFVVYNISHDTIYVACSYLNSYIFSEELSGGIVKNDTIRKKIILDFLPNNSLLFPYSYHYDYTKETPLAPNHYFNIQLKNYGLFRKINTNGYRLEVRVGYSFRPNSLMFFQNDKTIYSFLEINNSVLISPEK